MRVLQFKESHEVAVKISQCNRKTCSQLSCMAVIQPQLLPMHASPDLPHDMVAGFSRVSELESENAQGGSHCLSNLSWKRHPSLLQYFIY